MWTQTVIPTEPRITVDIPAAFMNQPVEVVLIPTRLADDQNMRQEQIHAFFAQFKADANLLRYQRDELYDR
ncbi:MAG: hypothetical protein NTX45_14770 [Proteobacteria bacterium]|nr:hypothetical protein [Pseudomonadota bacterium]